MTVDVRLNAIVDPERANGRSLADLFVKQESVICRPASFSPLQ